MQLRTRILGCKWLGHERVRSRSSTRIRPHSLRVPKVVALTTEGVLFVKSDLSTVLERSAVHVHSYDQFSLFRIV
jgi:hypothetical protein